MRLRATKLSALGFSRPISGGGGGIVTSGLVMHLDAGNAASYPGSGTAWTDLSGNSNNGTLTNGPTYSAADGGQIVFDGVNDFLNLSYTQPSITAYTIEVWFKSSGVGGDLFLFQNRGTGLGRTQVLGFNTFSGTGVAGSLWTGHNSNEQAQMIRSVATNFNDGAWRQVVGVFNQSSGQPITAASFSLYQNGSAISSSTDILQFGSTNSPIGPGEGNATMFSGGVFGTYTPGFLAVARIYHSALNASQVSQNFNANRGRFGL